jgi:hypothetical protein
MSDYLAQLKMKIQKTPNPDTDKTDKSPPCFPIVHPSVSSVSGSTKHAFEIAVASPRIVKDPHFGCDHVPARYVAVWEALLAQRPPRIELYVWESAIYDAADLFGWWGAELARLGWPADAIFALPHDGKPGGLAWFSRGDPVVSLGPHRAFTQAGRIFDRGEHDRATHS